MAKSKIQFASSLLRRLHGLQQQKFDLENELKRGPIQIKAGETLVQQAQAATDEAKESIKQTTIASNEKQLQLKQREDRIEDFKAKLNTAASNREFDTLKEQIAADEQANSVMSDEIFEVLERIDVLNEELADKQALLEKQQADYDKREAKVLSRMQEVKENLAHVTQELAKAELEIPSEARAAYNRLTASKADEAMAPLEEGTCGCCSQTMTTQVVEQLRMSLMVNCPMCNAFLYIAEDTRVQ